MEEKKVASVDLKLCFKKDRVAYWNRENVFLDSQGFATPIGKIFCTEEAAIAALED